MDLYPKPIPERIDRRTRIDMVCFYFSQGRPISSVVDILRREHGITGLSRDTPYHDLAMATSWGWLSYNPSTELRLASKLRENFPLSEVIVPSAGERMTTVTEAAELVVRLTESVARRRVREMAEKFKFIDDNLDEAASQKSKSKRKSAQKWNPDDPEPRPMEVNVTIGFSGGRTMENLSTELGIRLSREIEDLERLLKEDAWIALNEAGRDEELKGVPKLAKRRFRVRFKLTLINLVAGFDTKPETNPISFLTLMRREEPLASCTQFKCFNSAPWVEIDHRKQALEPVAELRDFCKDVGFDIILTGAGSIDDPHSTFSRYYTDKNRRKILQAKGVKGDFLWLPVTSNEPFEFEKDLTKADKANLRYRPITLIDLRELAEQIERNCKVVLVLGPCGRCHTEKSQVLRAVLGQEKPILTHLVADRHTARATLEEEGLLEGDAD